MLTLPPVMSSADSAQHTSTQWLSFYENHVLNIISPQHLLADARLHLFPERFQLAERSN